MARMNISYKGRLVLFGVALIAAVELAANSNIGKGQLKGWLSCCSIARGGDGLLHDVTTGNASDSVGLHESSLATGLRSGGIQFTGNASDSVGLHESSSATGLRSGEIQFIQAAAANSSSDIELPQGFRICRIKDPAPVYKEPQVSVPGFGIELDYQCAGQPYNDFIAKLYQFVRSKYQRNPEILWGQRPHIIPNIDIRHKTILIMGNSHTRQMAAAMLCQYKEQITSQAPLPNYGSSRLGTAISFHLVNNVTIHVICNHPFVFSKRWTQVLKEMLNQHISTLDAIVLGRFNGFVRNSKLSYHQTMYQFHKDNPSLQLNLVRGPILTITEVAKVYSGPIVGVSMFSISNKQDGTADAMKKLVTKVGRTNLRAIDGGVYGNKIGSECRGSNHGRRVGTCLIKEENGQHCCIGEKGGRPDIVAWEVIEALSDVLEN